MTSANSVQEPSILSLPITARDRQLADQIANQQSTADKSTQVRLNTLAVQVMRNYFELLDISTDWSMSDSCSPLMQLCADVADLELPGIGRLECRPLSVNQSTCVVPPEVWDDRIGYVVVQIEDKLDEAHILGFVPTVEDEDLPIQDLQSVEDLLTHLDSLRSGAIATRLADKTQQTLIHLTQWISAIADDGWQALDALLNPRQLGFAMRGSAPVRSESGDSIQVRSAKPLTVGEQQVVLAVEVTLPPETDPDQSVQIVLSLFPAPNQRYLPSQIRLTVLDEAAAVFLEGIADDTNDRLDIQLHGQQGERFDVQIHGNNASVVEHFVI